MINILIRLSCIFLIIMFIKNIMDMKKYNSESQIVELKDLNIDNDKKIMDPLLIDYDFDVNNIQKYVVENPLKYYCNGDMCIRLSDLNILDNIHIYKNIDLCIIGEGEATLAEIIKKLISNGKKRLNYNDVININGLAFSEDNFTKLNSKPTNNVFLEPYNKLGYSGI